MLPVKLEILLEKISYRNHHIYVTISTFVSDTSLFHTHCKVLDEFPGDFAQITIPQTLKSSGEVSFFVVQWSTIKAWSSSDRSEIISIPAP